MKQTITYLDENRNVVNKDSAVYVSRNVFDDDDNLAYEVFGKLLK